MKILSWNILQGGGGRMDGICETIAAHAPDMAVLQEVRAAAAGPLLRMLAGIGLRECFLAPSGETDNTLLIAARTRIDAGDFMPDRTGPCHILEAEVEGLTLLPVHFPQKEAQIPLFEALLADGESLLARPALLLGDLNCGIPFQDSTHRTFANARRFEALLAQGWTDLYRQAHGAEARDYSWISPRTGRGFRYDHALASPGLAMRLDSVVYDHAPREARLSDHSVLLVSLRRTDPQPDRK